ncbi:MAG: hypothetical protein WCF85_05425 [Rhodospirillaceae bacterium]
MPVIESASLALFGRIAEGDKNALNEARRMYANTATSTASSRSSIISSLTRFSVPDNTLPDRKLDKTKEG